MTSITTAKAAARLARCAADRAPPSSLRRAREREKSTETAASYGLDGEAHDVLVGLHELVADLDGELQHQVGLLQGNHLFVHVAGAVKHLPDRAVGLLVGEVGRLQHLGQ